MNTQERAARVTSQAQYAEKALQADLINSDVKPRLRIAEEVLIEGLSIEQHNEYTRARVALLVQFAQKID